MSRTSNIFLKKCWLDATIPLQNVAMILNYSQFGYLYDCVYMNDTDESDSSEVVPQCLNLFFCLVKHAGDLSQAQAQSLPYLLTAGVQLGGLAGIDVCGNEMV